MDWSDWEETKVNLGVLAVVVIGCGLVVYDLRQEKHHFLHSPKQPPYSFFMNRDEQVGAGMWPGRSCQWIEFNCFARAYKAADELLEEKQGGGTKHSHDSHH